MRTRNTLSLLLACALPAMAQLHDFKPGFNSYSPEQDVQLGQRAAQQVRAQSRVVRDSTIDRYIQQLGQRLASTPQARQSGFPFTFEVVEDQSINAFALPGGPMFINTGLLKAVDNESQLAGVMAHEMTHVILRHGTHQASKSAAVSTPLSILGAILGRNGGVGGALAQTGVGLAGSSLLLRFSRDAEKQADLMGTQIMSEAGYNPLELARFFEKLGASNSARTVQFLSDHPNPGSRERYIEDEVRYLPRQQYRDDPRQLQLVQARLRA